MDRTPGTPPRAADFNKDFGLTTDKGENYGLSVFIHDDKDVYRTYFTDGRGVEGLNIWTFLDLTPLGRQEEWEDSPAGGPRTKPFVWWRRHDEYGKDKSKGPGEMSNCPFCNLDTAARQRPSGGDGESNGLFSSCVAKYSMALPRHAAGVDAQMPDVRGGLCRVVHRHGHQHVDRTLHSDTVAGFMSIHAALPRGEALALWYV